MLKTSPLSCACLAHIQAAVKLQTFSFPPPLFSPPSPLLSYSSPSFPFLTPCSSVSPLLFFPFLFLPYSLFLCISFLHWVFNTQVVVKDLKIKQYLQGPREILRESRELTSQAANWGLILGTIYGPLSPKRSEL